MLYYKNLLDDIISKHFLCEDITSEVKIYSIFKVSVHRAMWPQSDVLYYLLGVLRSMGFSDEECENWFHNTKIPYYNGRTPLEIVQNNEGERLIDDLVNLQLGHTGG